MDDVTLIAMHAAVLVASLLQAATGIGFGVIAGPIILLAMNSGSAVQVTILLSLMIAVILVPSIHRAVDKALLKRFLIGSVAGLPVGIAVFTAISVDFLKLFAGLAVLFMAYSASRRVGRAVYHLADRGQRNQDVGIGVLSGAMSASLAMPGPVVAARMSALACPKEAVRATILMLFVYSYIAAFGFQWALVDVAVDTLWLTATLVPATLIGILLGRLSVAWISERVFRWLIITVLVATSLGLLVNATVSLAG